MELKAVKKNKCPQKRKSTQSKILHQTTSTRFSQNFCNIFECASLWWVSYLPNPSARTEYDTMSVFKRSLTGLNSEFFFSWTSCLTKAEEPSLPYYLPIAGGRIFGFIPFTRVLGLCEMQSVSSKIWTRVAVSISYDDNHYTTVVGISYDQINLNSVWYPL